jgi:hypothetical protein
VLSSAPPAPPLDPEALFRNLVAGVLEMALPDKIEVFASALMVLLVFMPWRTFREDDQIGLITWGGFWTLIVTSGLLGVIYARHARRLPTIPDFVLLAGEAALGAITIALPLVYALTHITRRVDKNSFGNFVSYSSVPQFGSILAVLCGIAIEVGAVMVIQSHRKAEQAREENPDQG